MRWLQDAQASPPTVLSDTVGSRRGSTTTVIARVAAVTNSVLQRHWRHIIARIGEPEAS